MVAWMPRVKGGSPGKPSAASGSWPSSWAGPYSGSTSMPLPVSERVLALPARQGALQRALLPATLLGCVVAARPGDARRRSGLGDHAASILRPAQPAVATTSA